MSRELTYISTVNCTTTALGAGETFTGGGEMTHHPDAMVTLKTDADATLYIDFSVDGGANWDTQIPIAIAADVGEFHTFVKGARHCRVRLVNGSDAQTYLRLQTEFGTFRQPNQAGNAAIQLDADAASVRPSDYRYEVARGLRTGATLWNKFGYNADVDIGTEVVAEFGGTFTPLTSASTLSIVSTSDEDATGQTGASGVVVYGIDANRVSQTEVVTLTGTTPVVTTSTWLGINRISVYLAGSALGNVGKITATAVTGGATQATMPAGQGTTQQCIFFSQANHQCLMDSLLINADKIGAGTTPKVTFKGWVYSAVSNAKYEVFRHLIDTSAANHLALEPQDPFVLGEKSVFWLEATTNTDNSTVNARFSLIEVKN